jgi:hypothetical protein
MTELKNCPFCGRLAELLDVNGFDKVVRCTNCTGRVIGFKTIKDAITVWNTRASDQQILVKGLEQIIFDYDHRSPAKWLADGAKITLAKYRGEK